MDLLHTFNLIDIVYCVQTGYGAETQIEYSLNFSPTAFFNGSMFEIRV